MMLKIILIVLLSLGGSVYAQSPQNKYGIGFVELGQNIKSVWKDYQDYFIKRGDYPQPFGQNCESVNEKFGNHKVIQCILLKIQVLDEVFDLKLIAVDDIVVSAHFPDATGERLRKSSSKAYVDELSAFLSNKYGQQPVITSANVKLDDTFEDEEKEYLVNCMKVLGAAYQANTINLYNACELEPDDRVVRILNQFPLLSAKRIETLYQIKLAESKKGVKCKNCNATVYKMQWGVSESNNVMTVRYYKRDATGVYRFLDFDVENTEAIRKLIDARKNMINQIESKK